MCSLLIAIPTLDYIPYQFAQSLANLVRHFNRVPEFNYDVCFKGGTLVHLSRDWLVRKAIDEDWTHVLWLDADMVFDPDIFEKLTEAMDEREADLACGIFRSRHDKRRSCLFRRLASDERWEVFPDGIFEIDACGMAGTLIKTKLLERVMNEYGTCFMPTNQYGEDLAFCERAQRIGCEMVATSKAPFGHIGQTIIWPDDLSGIAEKTEQ